MKGMGEMTLQQTLAIVTPAGGGVGQGGKMNKGSVLQKSVEYIRYLQVRLPLHSLLVVGVADMGSITKQQLVEMHSQRNAELEHLVNELRSTSLSGAQLSDASPMGQEEYSGMVFSPPPPHHGLGDMSTWAMKVEDDENSGLSS